jgi:hypothetical protein
MPPSGGNRRSLVSVAGDAYRLAGDQNAMRRFRATWGTGGIFGPGEPLVPPEPEKTRLWDFPVGWNYIYTPRAYEPVSFAQLRALADNHDITRLCIETRSSSFHGRSARATRTIRARTRRRASRRSKRSGAIPTANSRSARGCASCWRICWSSTRPLWRCAAPAAATSSASTWWTAPRSRS